jgi:glyoxylase-like metal-dependent hydrolase (beta-lactamase superfamily II)
MPTMTIPRWRRRLAAIWGARCWPSAALAGRNPALAALPDLGGGEGLDLGLSTRCALADGDSVTGPDWSLHALHTPGHLGNHICLSGATALFSGDMAMGWSTSIVSPPDGDMTAYMASLDADDREGAAGALSRSRGRAISALQRPKRVSA